ncbi:hypothetical protein [Natronobacterium haloterrestre]|nr:hypothetical protein [Halobiforma haloterrestris]
MAIELQDVDDAFEDILVQAITSSNDADPEASGSESESESEPEPDVEFLKERIRRLESLLEDSLDKI